MTVTFKKGKGAPFSVRLSPRVRFALELLGRKQNRTHSAIIERAIEREALEGLVLPEGWADKDGHCFSNMLKALWDPEEADRFVNLAITFPDLLTYPEEFQWKLIRESRLYWENDKPNMETIRRDFNLIKQAAIKMVTSKQEEG